MEEITKELRTQFRQQQDKFVYYINSLSVAGIGFSVYKTTGLPLQCSQIPLGVAILCWAFSIFSGLRFTAYNISMLYTNHDYLLMKPHEQSILKPIMERNIRVAERWSKAQQWLFYCAVVLFVAWHVIEMYLVSVASTSTSLPK